MSTQAWTLQYQKLLGKEFLIMSAPPKALAFADLEKACEYDPHGIRRSTATFDTLKAIEEFQAGKLERVLWDGEISIPVSPKTHVAKIDEISWGGKSPWRLRLVAPEETGADFYFGSREEADLAARSLGFEVQMEETSCHN